MRTSVVKIAAVLAVMLGAILTGCGRGAKEQPEQAALLAMARENPAGSLLRSLDAVPERYRFTYENADGSISIQVDAPVILPETESLPMVAVEDRGFENGLVKKAFRYFYPGEKPCDPDGKRTNGTMRKTEQAGGNCKVLSCLLPEEETGLKRELVVKSFGQVTKDSPGHHFSMQSALEYERDDGDAVVESILLPANEGVPQQYQAGLQMEPAAAHTLGESFLQALGLEDSFRLDSSVLLVDGAGNGSLRLLYARQIEGCPAALTGLPGVYGIWGQESLPWGYEYLEIVTDDRGIAKVRWQNPITSGKTLVEDCRLLPFAQIAESLEAALPELYPDALKKNPGNIPIRLTGTVEEIRLELLRVQNPQGEGRQGLLVPAWVFYGGLLREEEIAGQVHRCYDPVGDAYFDQHDGPMILAAINAVDGSAIDLAKGY